MIIKNLIHLAKSVRPMLFLYYNYFAKNVIHKGKGKIIPYKNAVLQISPNAKIVIGDGDIEIGTNKLKRSKAETYLRMAGTSMWEARNGCQLFFNSFIDIKDGAVFDTGFFTMNSGSTVVCGRKIVFGEDVMLGRDIIIYDSDFHQVQNNNGEMTNYSKPVVVGDHVWLTNQIMVLKGVNIGSGSLVSPGTVLRKDIPERTFVVNGSSPRILNNEVRWSRKPVTDIKL